jgi:hypothetical protein
MTGPMNFAMFNRISSIDPNTVYRQLSEKRLEGTTTWLTDDGVFKSWLTGDTTSHHGIWLSGKGTSRALISNFYTANQNSQLARAKVFSCMSKVNGYSRSIRKFADRIRTTAIDECLAKREDIVSSAVLIFFFQGHGNTVLSLFESLTKQLIAALVCNAIACPPRILFELEEAYGKEVPRPEISRILYDFVIPLCTCLQQVAIVVDGVDECGQMESIRVLDWLGKLLNRVKAKIIISSEDQMNVMSRFKGFSRIQIDHHNAADIDFYIEYQIAKKSGPSQIFGDERLRNAVKAELQVRAEAMSVQSSLEFSLFF